MREVRWLVKNLTGRGKLKAFKHKFPRFLKYLRAAKFLYQVDIRGENECWEWKGRCDEDGYGQLAGGAAHVTAYKLFVGKIPKRKGKKGLSVCHSCDNPPCCNPNHLWLGSDKQNRDDMKAKGRGYDQGGEANPYAKLTLGEVETIRNLYATGAYTPKDNWVVSLTLIKQQFIMLLHKRRGLHSPEMEIESAGTTSENAWYCEMV